MGGTASSPEDRGSNPQNRCRIFTLPGELRNHIYELIFDDRPDGPIELLSASPPSKFFILTYRRAYDEAAVIYQAAYQRYWSANSFRLTHDFETSYSTGDFVELKFTDMIRDKAAKNHAAELQKTVREQATEGWSHVRDIKVIQLPPHFLVTAKLLPQYAVWERKVTMLGTPLQSAVLF